MAKKLQLLADILSDDKVRQLILEQLGQFVVIGPDEPDRGPVLWFDTNVIPPDEELTVYLVLGDDASNSDVTATIDDAEYSVLNVDSPSVSEDNTVLIQIND